MSWYPLLKHLHIFLALLSGLGFALRGFAFLVLDRRLTHPLLRITPHVVDTLLLASGISLWVMVGWPFMSWLGLKISLVVVYIALGVAAFRARARQGAVGFYILALSVFVVIAYIALNKPF